MMVAFREAVRRLFPPLKVRAKLWPIMLLLAGYGVLVSYAIQFEHLPQIEWGAESTVVNGLALSFLIGFRNNHAYDRWWEARKLWGQLINENRNLCLKVRSLAGIDAADREAVGRLIITFAESLKDHLRRREGQRLDASRDSNRCTVAAPAELGGSRHSRDGRSLAARRTH